MKKKESLRFIHAQVVKCIDVVLDMILHAWETEKKKKHNLSIQIGLVSKNQTLHISSLYQDNNRTELVRIN